MATIDPITAGPRRFSIRLPRPLSTVLAAAALLAVAAGISWDRFRSGPVYERAGIKYSLDLERALSLAKLSNKPALVYFTGTTCVNGRRMEKGVLSAPAVTKRLHKFTCAAAFMDRVPYVDGREAARLLEQNLKINEVLTDVTLPAFVVIRPDFDLAGDSARHNFLTEWLGLTDDEEKFARFLDDSLETWIETQQSAAKSLAPSRH